MLYVCTGDIDAFSVGLLGEDDRMVPITLGQIFKWNKIYLNVQDNYDPQTGQYIMNISVKLYLHCFWTNMTDLTTIFRMQEL